MLQSRETSFGIIQKNTDFPMYIEVFETSILPRNMERQLIPFVTSHAARAEKGTDIVLGIKKIVPTNWDGAPVIIFARDELKEALSCLERCMPHLKTNPGFLPECYAEVVIFFVDEKRLEAYITDETAEKNGVDERLAGLIRSMKKQRATTS